MSRSPSLPGAGAPYLSVVVPLFNEELNVEPLARATRHVLAESLEWELVLVDDGSADGTAALAEAEARADPRVRLVRLAKNYGQTAAMQAGFDAARGRIVVSMDGDLQNDPRDIPKLVAKLEEGYDLVAGYRLRRQDRVITRKIPSWIANRLIGWITGVRIRDNGCSLKAYRRVLLQQVHLYSDMHRFIPAVAAGTAGARIAEVPVRHHARRYGESKYGLSRVGKVLADILTIKMIRSFKDRPLRLFGLGAVSALVIAVAFLLGYAISLLWFRPEKANALVLPAAGMLWAGVGLYLLMLGLIAETLVQRRRGHGSVPLPLSRERGSAEELGQAARPAHGAGADI